LASYYAHDGPIYSGTLAEPPDQLIAEVQAALQDLGYYDGEADGILGPATQDALAVYQEDNELYETSAIDQPTLDSLGLG
jgi:peptidoglycan hydrolase-like protein with peptidoglycan-binding domain